MSDHGHSVTWKPMKRRMGQYTVAAIFGPVVTVTP